MSMLWKLNTSDFVKGIITAVLTAVLTSVYEVIKTGSFAINWSSVLLVGLAAGIGYVLKNLGTDSEGKFAGRF